MSGAGLDRRGFRPQCSGCASANPGHRHQRTVKSSSSTTACSPTGWGEKHVTALLMVHIVLRIFVIVAESQSREGGGVIRRAFSYVCTRQLFERWAVDRLLWTPRRGAAGVSVSDPPTPRACALKTVYLTSVWAVKYVSFYKFSNYYYYPAAGQPPLRQGHDTCTTPRSPQITAHRRAQTLYSCIQPHRAPPGDSLNVGPASTQPSPPRAHTSTACCGDAARTRAARTPDGCSPPLSVA